ncbi:MAG TPA: cytochrome c maturation protein CcmE [Acidimicrobiia bacterium]|nr:cytochrome c maturation protein CcmE [Acidimicrobiia bacterium]
MSKRTRTLGLLGIITLCIVALVYVGLKGNVIYYYDVSEAVQKAESQGTDRFRIAGAVVNESVVTSGEVTKFKVTDGDSTVAVTHRGDPPQLFKDGAPVVAEGHWVKGNLGKTFDSDRIMIKHGNEYTPPAVEQDKKS